MGGPLFLGLPGICGAYGKVWTCTSMAGSRDSWEWGKGIWYLGCLNMTGFKQELEFLSQDVTVFCLDVLQFFSSVLHLPHVDLFQPFIIIPPLSVFIYLLFLYILSQFLIFFLFLIPFPFDTKQMETPTQWHFHFHGNKTSTVFSWKLLATV